MEQELSKYSVLTFDYYAVQSIFNQDFCNIFLV